MIQETDIIWEGRQHTVRREPWGYGVYREGVTHAVLVGRYGHGQPYAARAIEDAEKRDRDVPQ